MESDDRRRAIGKVITVNADRFVVELHRGNDNFTVVGFDDIHYVARLGSFVVIPTLAEYVVAEVTGLWEKDPTASRPDRKGEDLDKASSAKYLEVVPLGMLPRSPGGEFRFGVSTFPSLYSDALHTIDGELDRIFEVDNAIESISDTGGLTRYRALSIGTSVIFQDYGVKVRIDEFFGGHSAVLGNTGSGKSCTIATILQSLFEKADENAARGATFVLFDVNGEYRRAFSKLPDQIDRLYLKVSGDPVEEAPDADDLSETTDLFRLPHWFLSIEEWELLLRATERTQQPVLRTALGLTTLFAGDEAELEAVRNHIIAMCLQSILEGDASSPSKKDRIIGILSSFNTTQLNRRVIAPMVAIHFGEMTNAPGLTTLIKGCILDDLSLPAYANAPFEFEQLEAALDLALLYEEAHGNRMIRDYCAQMLTRAKSLRHREEFAFLRVPTTDLKDHESDALLFIEYFLGLQRKKRGYRKTAQIIILDMNESVDEVVEVASSVMSRLLFERLRKADPRNRFPVNFVLEEAHRYIAEHPSKHAIDAGKIFERIAKEGRKYGLFLMVSSQRPSELSKTVLSQCSNFVVHRIQNPDDLAHIRQMTPFISDSVLKRLPSLPKQHALIFGNAVNLPTTFKVRDAAPRPKSDDAKIRELWFRAKNDGVELLPSN